MEIKQVVLTKFLFKKYDEYYKNAFLDNFGPSEYPLQETKRDISETNNK